MVFIKNYKISLTREGEALNYLFINFTILSIYDNLLSTEIQ